MTDGLDPQAKQLMSRVWPKYTAAVPRQGESVDVYRAERDAYVREVNVSAAKVARVDLITVDTPTGNIDARIYRPIGGSDTSMPAILYFHGGGWTVGGGDALDGTYRAYCAESQCVVIVPDYRLAPEHKFPAAVDDCWAAAKWLASNAEKIGIDPRRLVVAGESSGGNLAAVVSALAVKDPTVNFQLQVLVYPALDLTAQCPSYKNAEDMFTAKKMAWYIDCYIRSQEDTRDPLASPVFATNFHGLPKTVVVTGGEDPLVDEAEVYVKKLKDAGVTVEYLRLDGWPHGFAFWSDSSAYRKMMDFAIGAIRKSLMID